ncbi:MAG TPA: immunoglobulin domain-containing protein [Verrucomicrobiota bacterium]|nr:immunoglobulin domain-containing protein [Verrucomicrobiota bacterium]
MIQVVQDLRNSIPLINGKPTYVRAHIRSTDGSFRNAERVGLNVVSLGNIKTFPPLAVPIKAKPNPDRGAWNDSLNFAVANSTFSAPVTFSLDIKGCSFAEPANPGGVSSNGVVTVNFINVPAMDIEFVGIMWTNAGGLLESDPNSSYHASQVASLFPVPKVYPRERNFYINVFARPGHEWVNITEQLEYTRLLAKHDALITHGIIYNPTEVPLYISTFTNEQNQVFGTLGKGFAFGFDANLRPLCGPAWAFRTSASQYIQRHDENELVKGIQNNAWPAAHEIAHLLGRPHTVNASLGPAANGMLQGTCGEYGSPCETSFPYFYPASNGTASFPILGPLGNDSNEHIYGIREVANGYCEVFPTNSTDLMSYCGSPQWISSYTYTNLIKAITNRFAPAQTKARDQSDHNYFVIPGIANRRLRTVEFGICRWLNASQAVPTATVGDFQLVVSDAWNQPLYETWFSPLVPPEAEPSDEGLFHVFVPDLPGMHRISAFHNGLLVATIVASSRKPVVTLLSPTEGEEFGTDYEAVAWASSDADADLLTHDVFYSADGGINWEAVALGVTNNLIPVRFSRGSTNALVKVTANDGFHSSSEISERFSVRNRLPQLTPLWSGEGLLFHGDVTVMLQCNAWDAEDGRLDGASITWQSSLNGLLGIGDSILPPVESLSEGDHIITVIATDSAGVSTNASTAIRVIHANPPTLKIGSDGELGLELALHGNRQATHVIEWSEDMAEWNALVTNNWTTGWADLSSYMDTNAPHRFYRARLISSFPGTSIEPHITAQPGDHPAAPGESATLSVGAIGAGPLVFQWRKGGAPLNDGLGISGVTTPTLSLANVQVSSMGEYDVIITNGFGSATSRTARLTVGLAPAFAIHPSSRTNLAGSSARFAVEVTGDPPLSFQWWKDGMPLVDGGSISGATLPTLSLRSIQHTNAGLYYVVVSNKLGRVTSQTAILTVLVPPQFESQPASRTNFVGSRATFSVTVFGTPPFSFQWRKDTVPLSDSGIVSGSSTATLTLDNVQSVNSGNFDVIVSNLAGSAVSQPALLTVRPLTLPVTDYLEWYKGDSQQFDTLLDGQTIANWKPENGSFSTPGTIQIPGQEIIYRRSIAELNGMPALEFPGGTSTITNIATIDFNGVSIFLVFKNIGSGGSQRAVAAETSNTLLGPWHPSFGGGYVPVIHLDGVWKIHPADVLNWVNPSPCVLSIVVDDVSTEKSFINGEEINSAVSSGPMVTTNIGKLAFSDAGEPYKGYIFEFIVYRRVLSVEEIDAVHNYLFSKYMFAQ